MILRPLFLLTSLLPLLTTAQPQDPLNDRALETITIRSFQNIKDLRPCAKSALYGIPYHLDCEINSCLCRHDLTDAGKSGISSYMSSICAEGVNTVDLGNAVSLYEAYCSDYSDRAAGSPRSNGVVVATATATAGAGAGTGAGTGGGNGKGGGGNGAVVTVTEKGAGGRGGPTTVVLQNNPTATVVVGQGNRGMNHLIGQEGSAIYILMLLVSGLVFMGMIVV